MNEKEPLIGKWERRLFLIAAIGLLYLIAHNLTVRSEASHEPIKIDSVITKEVHHYHVENNNLPAKVIIQQKRDTVYRDKVEKETIITGVKIEGNKVAIQKVDPEGKISEEVHVIEQDSKVLIDNNSFQEKKKTRVGKILKKAKKVVLRGLEVAGAVAIIYMVVK